MTSLNNWIDSNTGNFQYKIFWPYSEEFNPKREAVDIYVRIPADREIPRGDYIGTFITFKHVKWLREGYKETGECAHGAYFPGDNLIFVDEISHKIIEATLEDLLKKPEFKGCFEECKSS